jgi:uncharacterized protein YjiS (DUF1127 family)
VPGPIAARSGFRSFGLARRALIAGLKRLLPWQERASQRHHLSMAEEHMLRDVGLRRADLEPEIRKPFWRS